MLRQLLASGLNDRQGRHSVQDALFGLLIGEPEHLPAAEALAREMVADLPDRQHLLALRRVLLDLGKTDEADAVEEEARRVENQHLFKEQEALATSVAKLGAVLGRSAETDTRASAVSTALVDALFEAGPDRPHAIARVRAILAQGLEDPRARCAARVILLGLLVDVKEELEAARRWRGSSSPSCLIASTSSCSAGYLLLGARRRRQSGLQTKLFGQRTTRRREPSGVSFRQSRSYKRISPRSLGDTAPRAKPWPYSICPRGLAMVPHGRTAAAVDLALLGGCWPCDGRTARRRDSSCGFTWVGAARSSSHRA